MKIKYISGIFLSLLFVLTGCELNSPEHFNPNDTNVSFDSNFSARFTENSGRVGIPVILAGVPGGTNVSITVAPSIEGISAPAIEGIDYTIENKSISFNNGYGVDSVYINIIDNDIFEGNKSFKLTFASVTPEGLKKNAVSSTTVTFIDDEHPLASILGNYQAVDNATSGAIDSYSMSISPIEGSITQITIDNLWDGGLSIVADVNLDENKMIIAPGQGIYKTSTYDIRMYWLDAAEMKFNTTSPIEVAINGTTIVIGSWVAMGFGTSSAYGIYRNTTMTKR